MDIFYKRPLSLILCILLGGFCLFSFLDNDLLPLAFVLLLLICLLLSPKAGGRTVCLLAAFALCISLLAATIYPIYFRVHERYRGTVKIEAIVTNLDNSRPYETVLDIKTERIEGDRVGAHRLKMSLAPDEAVGILLGSVIVFDGELAAFESSDDFDAESYYSSRGFSSMAIVGGDIEITGREKIPDFGRLRDLISRKTVLQSGKEAASLFSALFTGERDHLSEDLRLDFTRIGINHVLALSGMHLAILAALLDKLLRVMGLGKKPRLLLLSAAVVFYMAMTGFSSSVTRAGIMLIITSLSFLFSSSRDSFTSLCVAVFLILLVEPYAYSDISLWLSALATLGVMEAANLGKRKTKRWCYTPEPRGKGILRKLLTGAGITLFAMSATLAISAFTFSGISPLSIITTPIFSFLAEVYIYAGLAALALGSFIPIGMILPPIYRIIAESASSISEWDIAYFSSDFIAVKIMAVISAMVFFTFIVIKVRQKIVGAVIAVSFLVVTLIVSGSLTMTERGKDGLLYHADDGCECILMRGDGELALLDLSSGIARSKYTLQDALGEVNAVEVDHLVFAYYTTNLPEKAEAAASAVLTSKIYIPFPKNDGERAIADEVAVLLEESHSTLCYYTEDVGISLGEFTLTRLYASEYGDGAPRGVTSIERDGEKLVYLSSGIFEDNAGSSVAENAIATCEHLILGSGGKSYKSSYVFSSKLDDLKTLILSGKRMTLTQEALIHYDENGADFYLRPESVEILP